MANTLSVKLMDITDAAVDCVVNAANNHLQPGSGVCGAIFAAAGYMELRQACDAISGCETGEAVITPGFHMKAAHIIHTVGPRWYGGDHGEPEQLYRCYQSSLTLAAEHQSHSIAFPLISSGIFGYPMEQAWEVAIRSVQDYFRDHPQANMDVTVAVIDRGGEKMGRAALEQWQSTH